MIILRTILLLRTILTYKDHQSNIIVLLMST